MHLVSFFAATVEAALAKGRRELGANALIVQSRKAPPESRHLGPWELVLAVQGSPPAQTEARQPPALITAAGEPLTHEVAELRRQIDGIGRCLSRSALAAPSLLAPSPATAELFTALVESDVDAALAQQIAQGVLTRLGLAGGDSNAVIRAAAAELDSRFSVDATLGSKGAAQRVVTLVGPPGSGKTTTLIKLAVRYGLAAGRSVMLLSADNHRIAAADQLRTYAAIMGVGFELAETPVALAQALRLHRGKELILIDTPGLAGAEMDQAADLAGFLIARPEIDTHLVVSSSMKSADITRAVDRFEIFRPAKLLFTRLDETETRGTLLNEAARTRKPISFLCTGQRIPEDLEPATESGVIGLVLPPAAAATEAAA